MALKPVHNESYLLAEIVNGNENAFEELFMAYHNQLAEYVLMLTHSKEITEEIVQDIFVKIWVNRKDLDQISKFTSYLFILTRNYTLNALRKMLSNQKSIDLYREEQLMADGNMGYDNEQADENFDELLEKSIDLLPPQQQQVFKYRMKGAKNPEIAKIMGISSESVRKYHKLALTALIKHVKGCKALVILFTLLFRMEDF